MQRLHSWADDQLAPPEFSLPVSEEEHVHFSSGQSVFLPSSKGDPPSMQQWGQCWGDAFRREIALLDLLVVLIDQKWFLLLSGSSMCPGDKMPYT